MANPGFNNPASEALGQAQMRRDDDQSSNNHNRGQANNFLQDTGTQVKNMAQGAADVGKGAALGAVSITKGVAHGAGNLAQGAADSMKNTFGSSDQTKNSSAYDAPSPITTHPSNI